MKKKALTFLLAFSIIQVKAQSDSFMASEGGGLLIGLIVLIIIFFGIRGILLWYWRVDTIVKNLEEQNKRLTGIYNSIEEQNELIRVQIELKINSSESDQ